MKQTESQNDQNIKVSINGFDKIPVGLDPNSVDNQIISLALKLDRALKGKVVLVTKDINFRVKCDSLGINAEDTNFQIPNSDDVKLPANSMATNILIDDKESIFELNFPNQKDVENIGKSQIKPILIGDYELEKEAKQPLRKKDNMNVPNIEKSTDRQAF